MTDKELAEIRARCEAATAGEWRPSSLPGTIHLDGGAIRFDYDKTAQEALDVAFVYHAREDMPKLLAEVERLRKQVAELDAECNDLAGY